MEPTNKPPVDQTRLDFLPDADEIERRPLPPLARKTVHILAAAFLLFIVWASVSEIDRVVVAQGRLVTPLPNIVLQPLETSVIQKINVRVGQVVKKGEALAVLDPTFTAADQAQLKTRLKSLENQASGLQAELGGQSVRAAGQDADARLQASLSAERQANYRAQRQRQDETIARLQAALATNKHDQKILGARVKSLQEIESMQEKLAAQQFSSRAAFLSAQEKRLEVERDLQNALNREQELQRELAAAEADRRAFVNGWRQKAMEDLLTTTRERDSVNEQLQKADKRRSLVTLTAPADAVVLEIARLSEGSVAKEAEPLFTLVPIGAALEAEVKIDSIDVGYVKTGDAAHIKLDAFPFQKHGTLDGKVRTVSGDSFRRDQVQPGSGTDQYYLSRVSFSGKLRNLGEQTRLLPGMTVAAEIVVGKRTVMSYLLWPLTKALDESIREP